MIMLVVVITVRKAIVMDPMCFMPGITKQARC